jgi:hypothetical protein
MTESVSNELVPSPMHITTNGEIMNKNSKSDPYLTKLKLALAAGGLIATMLGAGLLGKEANTSSVETTSSDVTESSVNISSETIAVDELDLNLEAIPTVTAPTFRNAPLALGRSSG